MAKFLFVDDDQNISVELWIEAATERKAHKIAWDSLTPEQKDACGYLICVDEVED
jgi:hypothetical protein